MLNARTPLLLCLIGLVPAAAALAQDASANRRTMVVTGQAEVLTLPDEVIVTLGVESRDAELAAAKRNNDERVAKLLALAAEFEVGPRDVKSDYIGVEPKYREEEDALKVTLYLVRRTTVIRLKSVARFEELLGRALESGANHVHAVEFATSELRRHKDRARSLALTAAREKAEAMASDLGVTVGRPVAVQEGWEGCSSSYNSGWSGRGLFTYANSVEAVAGDESNVGETFKPGQLRITANVTVTYELE